jgi:hypothetical protein
MSLTAVLVLTVVVLVLMGGWLGVLFFVARQPGGSAAQRAGDAGEAAVTPGRPGQ